MRPPHTKFALKLVSQCSPSDACKAAPSQREWLPRTVQGAWSVLAPSPSATPSFHSPSYELLSDPVHSPVGSSTIEQWPTSAVSKTKCVSIRVLQLQDGQNDSSQLKIDHGFVRISEQSSSIEMKEQLLPFPW